tara:strand:- start:1254 stop:1418 length:165 start_codon:yes stop_codon:yes gene_type:complete
MCGYVPVKKLALDGEQIDWVTKKFLTLTPSFASLSIFGVFKKGYLLENPTASYG